MTAQTQFPPFSDPRLGLSPQVVAEFEKEGFDTGVLYALMRKFPSVIRDGIVGLGLDFDDLLRRLKEILPTEFLDRVEKSMKDDGSATA